MPLCLGSWARRGCENSPLAAGSVRGIVRAAVLVPTLTAAYSALSAAELTAAHFGGGGLQKTSKQPGQEGERPRSRKELIEELITKSKQEKVRWPRSGCGVAPQQPAHKRLWSFLPFQAAFAVFCESGKSIQCPTADGLLWFGQCRGWLVSEPGRVAGFAKHRCSLPTVSGL